MLTRKEKRELLQVVLLLTEELATTKEAGFDVELNFYGGSDKVRLTAGSQSATLTVANKGQITWDYDYMIRQSGTPERFLAERVKASL